MLAALLWLAALAAQEEEKPSRPELPIRLTLSGEIDMDAVFRSGSLNEAAFWFPGGLPNAVNADRSDMFISPSIRLRLDAEFSPEVSSAVELGVRRIGLNSANPQFQDVRLGADPKVTQLAVIQAYVEVRDWPVREIDWRVGEQHYIWDPTGSGDPLVLALGESESPWIKLPKTTPPFPLTGTSTTPVTRRDELDPVGITGRWRQDALAVDLLCFPVLRIGNSWPLNEQVYGLTSTLTLDHFTFGALGLLFVGATPLPGTTARGEDAYTVGGAASARFLSDCLKISAEGYFQFGTVTPDLTAQGRAFRAAVRGSLPESWAPWLEVSYTWVSGDKDGLDGSEGRFLSYENNDRSPLVEGNEFGLDIDSNYAAFRIAGGSSVRPFEGHGPLDLWGQITFFRMLNAIPLPPDPPFGISDRSDRLGNEFDCGARFAWSKSLSFISVYSILFGSEVLQNFTREQVSRAQLLTFGFRLRF